MPLSWAAGTAHSWASSDSWSHPKFLWQSPPDGKLPWTCTRCGGESTSRRPLKEFCRLRNSTNRKQLVLHLWLMHSNWHLPPKNWWTSCQLSSFRANLHSFRDEPHTSPSSWLLKWSSIERPELSSCGVGAVGVGSTFSISGFSSTSLGPIWSPGALWFPPSVFQGLAVSTSGDLLLSSEGTLAGLRLRSSRSEDIASATRAEPPKMVWLPEKKNRAAKEAETSDNIQRGWTYLAYVTWQCMSLVMRCHLTSWSRKRHMKNFWKTGSCFCLRIQKLTTASSK